jgi:ribulose-phosphate 3-epimerase
MKLVAPSLLATNFTTLSNTLQELNQEEFSVLHLDVMDGDFVPPITFGSQMVSHLRPLTMAQLDVHLMTYRLEQHIETMAKAGANSISFHLEAAVHSHRLVAQIKDLGCKAGVAIVPSTPTSHLQELLPFVDYILVMSVNPGYGGQRFIEQSLTKVEELDRYRTERDLHYLIEVDGGVNKENAKLLWQKGANILVVGTALINEKFKENSQFFKTLAKELS